MSGEAALLLPIQGGYERETEGWVSGDPSSPHQGRLEQFCETRLSWS